MMAESLKLNVSFSQKFLWPKQRLGADFIVVKTGHCFLGYSTATDFGILRVGLAETLGTGACNTVDRTFVRQLKATYPNVFLGIGKLKGCQLKLHIDPSVTLVAQKMRRVPFSLKDKVTTKVDELLEKGHN